MDTRALAQQLLDGLARTLTVDSLKLDDRTNSCVLLFDDSLVINIELDEHTRRLVLSAYLHEIPASGVEPLLRELLAANLYWSRTQGATLCLEEGTGGILLVYAHSVADLDAAGFEAVLQNFVNQAERWTKRLKQAEATPPVANDAFKPGSSVLFG